MKDEYNRLLFNKKYLIAVLFITSLLFLIGGYFYYDVEKKSLIEDKFLELKTISELKRNQIEQWFFERTGDASVVSSAPFIKKAVANWLGKGLSQPFPPETIERLTFVLRTYRYEDILIFSKEKNIIYSIDSLAAVNDPPITKYFSGKKRITNVLINDLTHCAVHKKIHLDIIAPLLDEKNSPFAYLIFRIDPDEFLYPLIQVWPTTSKSAETFIGKLEGDSVLYLNRLRFSPDPVLTQRVSIAQRRLPIVQAALGVRGIFEGYDYRGVNVVSYLTSINQTKWLMASKVNRDEIFRELSLRTAFIASITIFLILLNGTLIAYFYYSRQRNMYKEKFTIEEKLKKLNETYKITLYSIGDAVITTDTSGRITQMNHIAEELTGWKENEALNFPLREVFQIINETTREEVDDPVKKVLKGGMIVGLANHTILISKDGRETPIADSGAPVRDDAGNINGVVLVFRDQSDERYQRNQLIESEKKFREIVTHLDEGYYSASLDGILIDHNKAFNSVLGINLEENLRGMALPDFWENPDDRKQYISQLMENGFVRNYVINAKRKDNSKLIVLANSHIVKDENNIPIRIEGTFSDITEKRTAEEIIETNEKRLNTLFSAMNELVFVINQDGTFLDIVAADPAKLFKSYEESVGRKIADIFDEEKSEFFMMKIKKVIETQQPEKIQYPLIMNGEEKWYSGQLSPFEKDKVMSVVHEITDMKKAADELQQSEQKFKDLAELLPQIVFEADGKGKVTYLNRVAFENIENLEEDFKKGVNVLDFLIPEDRQRALVNFRRRLAGELTGHTEYTAAVKGGKRIPIIIYATVIMKDGQAAGLRGVIIDITEIKQAQVKILKEKEFTASLIEDLPGIFYLFDQNGKFKKWNKKFEMVSGYSSDEMEKIHPTELFRGEEKDYIAQRIMRVFQVGVSDAEALLTSKDGTQTPYYFTGTLIHIDGEPHLVGMGVDISERIESQKSLVELHNAVNESGDVVFMTDKEGIFISVNHQFTKLYGFTGEEVVGKETPRILKSGAQSEQTYVEFWRKILSGKLFRGEVINKTKEGKFLTIEETVNPIIDAEGKVTGFLAIQRDVTERKKNEEEIVRRSSELASLNQLAKELAASLSLDKSIDSLIENVAKPLNASMVLLFEVKNKKLELLKVGPKGSKYHEGAENILHIGECLCGEAVKNGNTVFSRNIFNDKRCTRSECKNSGIISFTCIPLKQGNFVTGALGIGSETETDFEKSASFLETSAEEFGLALNNINLYEEINKLNRDLEKKVELRTRQLQESNADLESFAYSVSHDLRAPIRAIDGFSKILHENYGEKLDDTGEELLRDIISGAHRMTQLIDDLLEFSRVGRRDLANEEIDMTLLFDQTILELKKPLKDIKIKFDLGTLPNCTGDYSLMRQAIMNLLSNAIKFSSKKREVAIEVKGYDEASHHVYSVRDNGVGFDMKYADKLFGVFQRLHGLNEFEGTGVGLAIVHRVVQRHGGKVWAKAERHKGATFYFSIPIQR